MKPLKNLLLVVRVMVIALVFTVLVETPVHAVNDIADSNSILYLGSQLENLIKVSAPSNQGLQYFIFPDSSEIDKIPADPKNPLTHEKIRLGRFLFHEPALSINPINPKHWKEASCASCHFAQAGFRSNLAQALGTGGVGWNKNRHRDPEVFPTEIDKQNILAPSVLNSAYQQVMLWNGRLGSTGVNAQEPLIQEFDVNRFQLDGLETQAIDGMVIHKLGTAAIARIPEYQELFAKAFPDRPYVQAEVEDLKRAGLAIAAYERTLLANEAPFQKWLRGDKMAMSLSEIKGGITFFSSSCIQCHNLPNLAGRNFSALGFDDHPQDWTGLNLGRGEITKKRSDDFKFKVPQLYNLADSSPYGHGASFDSIREVVQYLNEAKPQKLEAQYSGNLSVWFRPLDLNSQEVKNLTDFLTTALRDPHLTRYVPEGLPSRLCFPNNDPLSIQQLGCDEK